MKISFDLPMVERCRAKINCTRLLSKVKYAAIILTIYVIANLIFGGPLLVFNYTVYSGFWQPFPLFDAAFPALVADLEYPGVAELERVTFESSDSDQLPICPAIPPTLVGPIGVWLEYLSYGRLGELYSHLDPGGHHKPRDCIARHRVAIIVPFRDREPQLRCFLHNMHNFLTKQQLDYTIFVVEQASYCIILSIPYFLSSVAARGSVKNQTFNKGRLMNAATVEVRKTNYWQCIIFHDVDMLPENDHNLYTCPHKQPRHLGVYVDKFDYKLFYESLFGGATAFTFEQFYQVNGFSNDYWGWGGEDDDMTLRLRLNRLNVSRYPRSIARYKMIKHGRDEANPTNNCRFEMLKETQFRWKIDGLNSLDYRVVSFEKKPLFTHILIDSLEAESKKYVKRAKCDANTT